MIEAAPPPGMERIQQRSLIIGIVALVLCIIGALVRPTYRVQFFHSYLHAYMFWLGIALGSLAILMLQHLTGGAWGLVIRRVLEAGAKTLPFMAILFLPIIVDTFVGHNLYIWSDSEKVKADSLLRHKSLYLNAPFFLVRAAVYFGVWIGLTFLFNKWSVEQDKSDSAQALALSSKCQRLAGVGILLYGFTITFAAFDWIMSLDPHWFSTIIGILILGGQVLSAFAFVIVVTSLLAERKPMKGVLLPNHFHDLGKLMLAFVMLWSYFSLSQYLIIWSANLPEEIPWYLHRFQGGWKWIGISLIFLHFALPFVLLLSRELKRNYRKLIYVAVLVLIMRMVDLFWVIAPEAGIEPKIITSDADLHATHMSLVDNWMYILAPIGLGGIWLWAFVSQLKTKPLLPIRDPYLEETLHHAGH